MRSASFRARSALASLLIPLLTLAGLTPVRAAQDAVLEARLGLVSIPVAHRSTDELGLKLRIVNSGERTVEGIRLTVGAGDLIRSRSALHASFEGVPVSSFSFTLDFPSIEIPAGEHKTVTVDTPVDELTGFSSEGGVRPLSLSVFSTEDTFTPLDTLTTQLLVYPSVPQEPLNVVPILPLNDLPARSPDGTFDGTLEGPNWLAAETGENGWVRAVIEGLDAATSPAPEREEPENGDRGRKGRRREPKPEPAPKPLHVGFAPTPRLIEELAAMADGFVRVTDEGEEEVGEDAPEATAARDLLDRLRAIGGREEVQPLLVPYSFPDLPTLDEELAPGHVGVQLTEAITVLKEVLDLDVGRDWVLPPAGRLDAGALQALQTAGVTEGVFFVPDALEGSTDPAGSGCPVAALSFVCPVRVTTDVGDAIDGYVTDADLQERLIEMSEPGAGRLEIQRVLAETAMVHAEQPGDPGRVLLLLVPAAWHPKPPVARTFFTTLREAPWLRSATPAEGMKRADNRQPRRVVDNVPPPQGIPDDTYFEAIGSAQEVVESFSAFLGEQESRGVLQRLRRNVLVAEGRSLWDAGDLTQAAAYVEDSRAEATGEMGKVSIGVPSQTTFTSRTGSLDISLFNETGYPIEARVVLRALDMKFDPAVIDQTFEPGTERLTVEAEAQTSGTFPIEVKVETADGYVVTEQEVQVRSTEFNVVALAITIGAVAFLILFYTVKVMRKRRSPPDVAEASTS